MFCLFSWKLIKFSWMPNYILISYFFYTFSQQKTKKFKLLCQNFHKKFILWTWKLKYNKQINNVLFVLFLKLGFYFCCKSANSCSRFFLYWVIFLKLTWIWLFIKLSKNKKAMVNVHNGSFASAYEMES